ncbi:hypothetical protein D9601_02370 [Sphingomonas sp. MA1305]|uniref:hypothetical protein n=1 Tax=Sphingomonas sp. MA1305 TaxID=2479204 RepID=UPI0018DF07BB|nr:hypothetical protein [Sphingomonas sp. MA1305]MBI0474210.1 hypothetical protein [Sphingomonas sp. MA1305]
MAEWAPIYFFWALVMIGVLPLAPINRVAALVVAARLLTQAAYGMGYNEPISQMVIFGVCGMLAMHNARRMTCFFSAALFVPLSIAAAFQIDHPTAAGWTVYGLAVLQAVVLIASEEWRKAIRHWLEATDPSKPDALAKLIAFTRRVRAYA